MSQSDPSHPNPSDAPSDPQSRVSVAHPNIELHPDSSLVQNIIESLTRLPRRASDSKQRKKRAPRPSMPSSKRSRPSQHLPPLSPIETLATVAAQAEPDAGERPFKRARSEALASPPFASTASRPSTSHVPSSQIVELSAAESLLALFHSNATPRIPQQSDLSNPSQSPYVSPDVKPQQDSVQTHTPPEEIASASAQQQSNDGSAAASNDSKLPKQLYSPQSLPSAGELMEDVKPNKSALDQGLGISVSSTSSTSKQKQKAEQDQPSTMDEETKCGKCGFFANSLLGETIHWTQCDGCENWFHLTCTKIKPKEINRIDKYFCHVCEATHGPPTFFRKSSRNRTNVDYKGLNEGTFSTIDEDYEHRYIRHFKEGTLKYVKPENFPRLPAEIVTPDYLQRLPNFGEPILIPAAMNPRPYNNNECVASDQDPSLTIPHHEAVSEQVQEVIEDDVQDNLDMVIPEGLTVRRIADIHGPDMPLEVIDVKAQEGDATEKWTVGKWADYYEAPGEKPIRNVISLEVSKGPLGRMLRRPRAVRGLDLQDAVWPDSDTNRVMVKFYVLMSVADCYTDFHVDFGGSSVFYHIVKGRKVFFFIPPTPSNLKKYEQWNKTAAQGHTFLPDQTKECYRVDLYPGDTMLIPSGWIHAVWTPSDSLVIGGNFLTHQHLGMQIKIHEIEKACQVPIKYRYPHFQKVMWYTLIKYLDTDPLPQAVEHQLVSEKKPFAREQPVWATYQDSDFEATDPTLFNARYYAKTEIEGWPDLLGFLYRTALIHHDRIDGMTKEKRAAVMRSIPKTHGDPLDLVRTFASWIAWKTGNILPPDWVYTSSAYPVRTDVKPEKEIKILTPRKNPDKGTHRSGPKKVVCDSCREKKVACKHIDANGALINPQGATSDAAVEESLPPAPTSPTPVAVSSKPTTNAANSEISASLLEETAVPPMSASNHASSERDSKEKDLDLNGKGGVNGEGKRRWGKACVDCRRSKRRCIHDESGKVDPNKQQAQAATKGQANGVHSDETNEGNGVNEGVIEDVNMVVNGHELDVIDSGEILTEMDSVQDMDIDPELLGLSTVTPKQGKKESTINGNGMINGSEKSTSPSGARLSPRAHKRAPPESQPLATPIGSATSPRPGSSHRANGMGKSMSPKAFMTSPEIPPGLTAEEEADMRLAWQLQQEQFGLRSRRAGAS